MWSIALLKNTLKVPPAARQELFQASEASGSEIWYTEKAVTDSKGIIQFNYDHMEHMDFLWNEEFQNILKAHCAKGSVRFGSLEGDNKGKFWGYYFDGKGGMRETYGSLTWHRRHPRPEPRVVPKPSPDPWT